MFGGPAPDPAAVDIIADDPAANEVAVTFARYCLPTIFFMGVHVVMGQILNARGKFGAMMWTPVLNNIVIIATFGMFIWVYGTAADSGMGVTTIPPEGIRLLGIGTLLGLVVQALAMIPYLRDAGFRIRLRFDWRGHGLGKAAKLAKWTVLFVLANQAGVLVVTQLVHLRPATPPTPGPPGHRLHRLRQRPADLEHAAGHHHRLRDGRPAAAALPRRPHDGDAGAVRDDISQGLRTSAVAIVPIAFGFLALGIPMCTLIFGSLGHRRGHEHGLHADGLRPRPDPVLGAVRRPARLLRLRGHPHPLLQHGHRGRRQRRRLRRSASSSCPPAGPWSAWRPPTAWPTSIGVGVAWRRLRKRLGGDLDGARVVRTYARLGGRQRPGRPAQRRGRATASARRSGSGVLGSLAALVAGGVVLLGGLLRRCAQRMRIEELNALVGMVRGRLGR